MPEIFMVVQFFIFTIKRMCSRESTSYQEKDEMFWEEVYCACRDVYNTNEKPIDSWSIWYYVTGTMFMIRGKESEWFKGQKDEMDREAQQQLRCKAREENIKSADAELGKIKNVDQTLSTLKKGMKHQWTVEPFHDHPRAIGGGNFNEEIDCLGPPLTGGENFTKYFSLLS